MDDIDKAADHMEREMAAKLATRRPREVAATGHCLFCDEPLAGALRFCGPECRDVFDAEEMARARRVGFRQGGS